VGRLQFIPILAALFITSAYSAELEAHLIESSSLPSDIDLDRSPLAVKIDRSRTNPVGYVLLSGRFNDLDDTLVIDGKKVLVSDRGEFKRRIDIDASKQTVHFIVVKANGRTEESKIQLIFPESDQFQSSLREISSERKDFVRLSGAASRKWWKFKREFSKMGDV
jgi:hypothetical protein